MICSDSLWNGLLLDVTWFLVAPGYGCASTLRRQVTRVTPKKWSHHLPITKDCWGRVSVFQSKTHWTSFNFSIVLAPSVDSPRFFWLRSFDAPGRFHRVVLLEACPPLATAAKENIQRNGAAARSDRGVFFGKYGAFQSHRIHGAGIFTYKTGSLMG